MVMASKKWWRFWAKPTPMWTLVEAQSLLAALQPIAFACDYNLALGGGVLNKGWSTNDLDIFVVPRTADRLPDKGKFLTYLRGGGTITRQWFCTGSESYSGRSNWTFQYRSKLIEIIFIVYDIDKEQAQV